MPIAEEVMIMALATLTFDSKLLHRPVSVSLLLPEGSAPKAVLTFLHGYTDRHDSALYYSALPRFCKDIPVAVVMPDAQCSFYLDTAYGQPYWQHLTQELPEMLKQWLRIDVSAQRRYLAGISMGGYGAAKMALQQPKIFAEVFLFSPVTNMVEVSQSGFDCNVTPGAPSYEELHMDALLRGRAVQDTSDDLYCLLKTVNTEELPKFHIYFGTEDFLHREICRFTDKLLEKGAAVEVDTSAGTHCWNTWDPFMEKMAAHIAAQL